MPGPRLTTEIRVMMANASQVFLSACLPRSFRIKGFAGGSDGKKSAYNARDPGSMLGLGRSPEER